MAHRSENPETRMDVVELLMKDACSVYGQDRWMLDYRVSYKDGDRHIVYLLVKAGTGYWSSHYIYLPQDVGDELALTWKKNHYRRFIGAVSSKTILKRMGVKDVDKIVRATVKEKKERRDLQTQVNVLNSQIKQLDDFRETTVFQDNPEFHESMNAVYSSLQVKVNELAAQLED